MRKRSVYKIFYSFLLAISLLLITDCDNNIDHGNWLHDNERGVWYQEVQSTTESINLTDASKAKAKYREILLKIPGLTSIGVTHYPFPDGNGIIVITFGSQAKLDDAINRDIIPSLLDGVPVVVKDTPSSFQLL